MARTYDVLDQSCLARLALELVADKWTILVISALEDGTQRYSQIHQRIGCITHKMLAQTLRRLETDGLLERKVYAVVPPKTEYTLTPLGTSLLTALAPLFHWGEANMGAVRRARSQAQHAADAIN
jgi:DNA-binding HxlR family transcriptional regulator